MYAQIQEKLAEIEQREAVQILYACESGSRAWGFASQDSDYDVRFIYLRNQEWYLRIDLEHCPDTINVPIQGDLDFHGWDLRKALQLLKKSNPTLIEWVASPIIYRETEGFLTRFRKVIAQYYNPKACFHHYASTAKGNYRDHLQEETVRLKKYFYVLRPLFAMEWIERDKGVVPMEFRVLMDGVLDSPQVRADIERLLVEKQSASEKDHIPHLPAVRAYIEAAWNRLEQVSDTIPIHSADYGAANQFFQEILRGS